MDESFQVKKVNIDTLPEYLKGTRERLSYTLVHVAHITNISEKLLSHLENGQYHKLPADVYVYGFLKSLAELYRTDAAALTEQYKKERGIHENVSRSQGRLDAARGQNVQPHGTYAPPRFAVTPRTITVAAVLLFSLFILGYLFYQVHTVSQPPNIVVTSPHDGDVIHASSLVVTGHTDVGDQLTINDQAVLVDSSGDFSQSVSLTPGQRELSFVAKNSFGKTSTKQVSVIADFQNPGESAGVQQAAGLSLAVSTLADNVTVTVQADGNQPVTVLFATPTSKTFTAVGKLVVGTSNAGATDVQLNGKDLGKLGKVGQPLQDVVFTTDSLGGVSTPTPTN